MCKSQSHPPPAHPSSLSHSKRSRSLENGLDSQFPDEISRDRAASSPVSMKPKTLPRLKLQKKDNVSRVPSQTSGTIVKNSNPLPQVDPNLTKHDSVVAPSTIRSSIYMSQNSADLSSLEPISDNPSHIIDKITRISTNLNDIASESFSIFNRSLEYFAQLSEKMVQIIQTQNSSYSVSITIGIGKLREKIGDFRNLLTQIYSNPSYDYTSLLKVSVNDISKSCRDLFVKMFSNK